MPEPIDSLHNASPTQERLAALRSRRETAYDTDPYSHESADLGHRVQSMEARSHMIAPREASREQTIAARTTEEATRELARRANIASAVMRYISQP